MFAFPPEAFDWRGWICPALFLAVISALAALVWRRSATRVQRIFRIAAFAIATLCFLTMHSAFQDARETLARAQCKNNLKWIVLAVHQYHDRHGRFPAPTAAEGKHPPTSWRFDLLPLFAPAVHPDPAAGYDRTRAWDDPANLPTAQQYPMPYNCPSSAAPQSSNGSWHTAYAFLTGAGTPIPVQGPMTIKAITDGTSETLLLVEACGRNIVWTEPRDVDVSRETAQINAPGDQPGTSNGVMSSYHEQGAHCALADGSVRFMSGSISPEVLRALTTAAQEDEPGEF